VRQFLPVDRDGFRCVLGLFKRVGDDERDGVPNMADDVTGEDRIDRHVDLAGGLRDDPRRRQRREMTDVGTGQYQPDPLHGPDLGQIADRELRVGVRRTQHHRLQRAARHDVGDVAAAAAQERVVFFALEGLPETEFRHRQSLPVACASAAAARRAPKRSAIQRDTT
jgi:hypothetical protein